VKKDKFLNKDNFVNELNEIFSNKTFMKGKKNEEL